MPKNMVRLGPEGDITIPLELRQRYGWREGDSLTLVDLGDGAFLITPHAPGQETPGREVAHVAAEEGLTLEDLLDGLNREQASYFNKH
jgi:AbrB family looped-hinge helix DNA binding protein